MKRLILSFAIIIALSSCSKDEETTPTPTVGGINTGDLRLFVIDTAKVNTVSMTGTNETTILNRKQNINSYIGSFSLNNDASKFVYVDNQSAMVGSNFVFTKTVRVANANGSGDIAIYTTPANTNTVSTELGFVEYGTSKIYFTTLTRTTVGGAISTNVKLNVTNFDGTGLVAENYNEAPLTIYNACLTSDGKFLAAKQSAPNIPRFVVTNRSGDNGGGTVVYQEVLTTDTALGSSPVFSNDNKFVYYAFKEGQLLKVRSVNMTTFAVETKTIATGITATSVFLRMSIASDNNRGIVVVNSFSSNAAPSKSYVFNLASSTSTLFNNNDSSITDIYAW